MLKKINRINNPSIYIYIYLILYFILNILFLTRFPAMHSDESWLSGLTRTMMNSGLSSTEYFFDLYPRFPHAIKSLFHILQIPFIKIFGYNLFSVRLLSLLFSIFSLVLFYKIIKLLTKSNIVSLLAVIILSIDIQYLYASHFARQEIIIVTLMLLGIYIIISRCESWNMKNNIIIASIIGISISIHPNSFIIALVMGSIYIYYLFIDKKFKLKDLVMLIIVTILFAALFIGISFLMDKNFIEHYLNYGATQGATNNGIFKLSGLLNYYRKLFMGISVTYYTPNIKLGLVIFAISTVIGLISIVFSSKRKDLLLIILPIVFMNIGFIIIGRYSQPGIILIFPLFYILMFYQLSTLKKGKIFITALLGCIILLNSTVAVFPLDNNYDEYIQQIENNVPEDAIVLANINTEYAAEYGNLYGYRNLAFLDDKKFQDYINENKINYIIYPQEMDFIYDNRPVWNIVYGNIFNYYDDMQEFINKKCQMIYEFESPYAMRILMYSNNKDWNIKIYKVMQ